MTSHEVVLSCQGLELSSFKGLFVLPKWHHDNDGEASGTFGPGTVLSALCELSTRIFSQPFGMGVVSNCLTNKETEAGSS